MNTISSLSWKKADIFSLGTIFNTELSTLSSKVIASTFQAEGKNSLQRMYVALFFPVASLSISESINGK